MHRAKAARCGVVSELLQKDRRESTTNMEKTEMNGNGSSALPLFVAGLGTGVVLTLLFAPLSGAATRGLIGRKFMDGEDWMKGKAAEAGDYVLTHVAGLRDGVTEAAEAIGRS